MIPDEKRILYTIHYNGKEVDVLPEGDMEKILDTQFDNSAYVYGLFLTVHCGEPPILYTAMVCIGYESFVEDFFSQEIALRYLTTDEDVEVLLDADYKITKDSIGHCGNCVHAVIQTDIKGTESLFCAFDEDNWESVNKRTNCHDWRKGKPYREPELIDCEEDEANAL